MLSADPREPVLERHAGRRGARRSNRAGGSSARHTREQHRSAAWTSVAETASSRVAPRRVSRPPRRGSAWSRHVSVSENHPMRPARLLRSPRSVARSCARRAARGLSPADASSPRGPRSAHARAARLPAAETSSKHRTSRSRSTWRRARPGVVIGRTSEGNLTVRIRGGSRRCTATMRRCTSSTAFRSAQPRMAGCRGSTRTTSQSIRVLKDATDITMYGVRGANGVIVIKTKIGALS